MKPRDPIRVLQLNVHRLNKVMISLINTSSTIHFHFLLIQEPHINFFSHLPMTDPNWHMIPPSMTNSPSLTGYTRVKSVIIREQSTANPKLCSHQNKVSIDCRHHHRPPLPAPSPTPPISLPAAKTISGNGEPLTHPRPPTTSSNPAVYGLKPPSHKMEPTVVLSYPQRRRQPHLLHVRCKPRIPLKTRHPNLQPKSNKKPTNHRGPTVAVTRILQVGNGVPYR